MTPQLHQRLIQEILRARERVYHVGEATPLQKTAIPGIDAEVFLKREDLSVINAYKWRGAYNRICMLCQAERSKPIIASSAGNHAQGVALAARRLGLQAKIYMPLSTPVMKQTAVKTHGGAAVEIILTGDSYNDAAEAALREAEERGCAFIHPYDDLYTIAGQATIADEVVLSGQGPFDIAFIQIGGGGLAAGVSTWLRLHYPDIRIYGVESEGQASMKASLAAGEPVTLDEVDSFCDGTAVKRPGALCFDICRDMLDAVITVSNEEVSAAMETTWRAGRFIPEPSGALGLAGLAAFARRAPEAVQGQRLISLICGANMDFSKLRLISATSALGAHRQKYLRFAIEESKGSLLELIQTHFSDLDISGFQYGKVSEERAWPVIAVEASPSRLESLTEQLTAEGVAFDDISAAMDTRYRVINYDPRFFHNPLFFQVYFPERKGALRELLKAVSAVANICYFNYAYTGEEIGRALMGFELADPNARADFLMRAETAGVTLDAVADATLERLLFAE